MRVSIAMIPTIRLRDDFGDGTPAISPIMEFKDFPDARERVIYSTWKIRCQEERRRGLKPKAASKLSPPL